MADNVEFQSLDAGLQNIDIEANTADSQRNSRISKLRKALIANAQLVAIAVSVFLGFLVGILVHDAVQESTNPSTEKLVMYIKFPGELFIRSLRMIIIPLAVSTLVVALAEIDANAAGKLGKRTFLYYFATTLFATILGIVLMKLVRPGEDSGNKAGKEIESSQITALDSLLDLLRNIVPPNLVAAALQSTQTKYSSRPVNFFRKNKTIPTSAEELAKLLGGHTVVPWSFHGNNVTLIMNRKDYTYSGTNEKSGTNFLGLIVFSIALGVVLRKLGEDGRALLDFCKSWVHVVMMLVSWIMWVSPLGILSLIAGSLAEVEDLLTTIKDIGLFVVVVITGFLFQSFIVYPLLYFIFVRKNPFSYMSGIVPAMITAFGTSSSAATLPVTIRCVTENNKVDRRVAQFCLPIGATCNMDGAALYFASFVIFIANLEKMYLNFGDLVMTAVVAIFVSTGASGIPHAGLSYPILCLEAVGVPIRFVGLIYTMDWITDRVGTATNVMGDAYGAGIINHVSTDLQEVFDENQNVILNHCNSSGESEEENGVSADTSF